MKLSNKIALVTGAALGFKDGGPSIGSAIAFKLASEGAKIVVVDVLGEMGEKTVETIKNNGGDGFFVKADVSNTQDVINVIKLIKDKSK